VLLTLLTPEVDYVHREFVQFSRPRVVKKSHVFKVHIHIDVVEDLLFYHHPREELVADGKVPWKEFAWQSGRADGDLDEDELHPPTRYYGQDRQGQRHPWDDEDDEGDRRGRTRGIINKFSN
jgi:hypothetical protein